ncbi:MAG: YrbL family protein, partial [Planctomycetota bacterium]
MLDLSEAHLIHRGANRACYRHPGAADRCIKVDLPGGEGTRQGLNAIEFEHYGDLVRRAGEALYRHAPRCHGYVETSLGPGLCFELIRDADGNASERFDRYISLSGCSCDDALALIDRLYGFVREAGVMLFDVNLHNLLVRVGPTRGVGGGVELVAIDWKGMR